jgi:NUMOD3 motif
VHSKAWKAEQSLRSSGVQNPFFGKTHSEKSRSLISKSGLGRKATSGAIAKMERRKPASPGGRWALEYTSAGGLSSEDAIKL